MPLFTSSQLVNLSTILLKGAIATDEETRIVSKHLVTANLGRVDSHGILRLTEYVDGIRRGFIKPGSKFEIVNERSSIVLANGNRLGDIILTGAAGVNVMDLAILVVK